MSDQDLRHTILRDVLRRNQVQSQVELLGLLTAEGLEVTQATLSRDLRTIGAVKGARGYEAPASNSLDPAARKRLGLLLKEQVSQMNPAGNLLIIKTAPDYAAILARELDLVALSGVLGTIAGRDTIFVATAVSGHVRRLQGELAKISGRADLRPL